MYTDLATIIKSIGDRNDSRAINALWDMLMNKAHETIGYFVAEGDTNIPTSYTDSDGFLRCHVFTSERSAQVFVNEMPAVEQNIIPISFAMLNSLLKNQAISGNYRISISDSFAWVESGEVVVAPSTRQVFYYSGDISCSYYAYFPKTQTVGNVIYPQIGATVDYITTENNLKNIGRVVNISGDMVVVQRWNGVDFDTGYWESYDGDTSELCETIIPLESCTIHPIEKTIQYMGSKKTVYASYVFAGEDFLLFHDIPCNQLVYRELFGKTYVCISESAQGVWNARFQKECNIEYESIAFIGCVYYTWPELSRHICHKGFLSNSLQSRIVKHFGDITFDPRYARDKAQVALINELS